MAERIIYRYRCGIAWRDLPADFGPWQTVWKRHRAWAADGTWDQVLDALLVRADADGELDWSVAVECFTLRAAIGFCASRIHTGVGLVMTNFH